MDLKQVVLSTFRTQWTAALKKRFQDDSSKLESANMKELAEEMFGHEFVKASLGSVGVTPEDVAQILEDARQEILEGKED